MPLRDHFRPPLDEQRHWEGFHGQWPAMMVLALSGKLPSRYFAEPRVHLGVSAEIDIGTFEPEAGSLSAPAHGPGNGEDGGVVTAVWAPPQPTLTFVADLPSEAAYEVRVFDQKRGCRLVAAVEIVSPANKDRPEHRRAFVAKCAALLQEGVSVAVVDVVTTRDFNLYGDLLELIGQADSAPGPGEVALYAAVCRGTKRHSSWLLQTWLYPLVVGRPLPTLLWLADDLAVPLELEESYEQTCRILRLP
jgi:hypothetical protein